MKEYRFVYWCWSAEDEGCEGVCKVDELDKIRYYDCDLERYTRARPVVYFNTPEALVEAFEKMGMSWLTLQEATRLVERA